MTIPASMPSRVVYQGDGVTVNFPIPFVYFGNGDGTKQIKAVLADATGENEQVLTENTDFTFTDAGQVNGTMIMKTAPTVKQKLTVIYDIPIEQLVDWKEFGRLPSESIEAAFDKVTAILKQQNEVLNRCVKVIVSGNQSPQELLDEVYEKLDSATAIAGTAITAANNAREAADKATVAVASAEQTLVEVTFYVDTAKVDIAQTVNQAKADIANTIIAAVVDVKQQAVDAAKETIASASIAVTQTATDNLNAYVDGTVEPSLQHFVDDAKISAVNAAVSAAEAAKTSTDFSIIATTELNKFNTNAVEKIAAVDASASSSAQSAAAAAVSQEVAETAKVRAEENANRAGVEAEIAKHYAQMAQGLPIGMIVPIPVSKTPARFLPCDGSEWLQSQFSQVDLQGFYDKLVSGEVESVTYDEFDSQVSVNGVCGLCAIDSINGKFKTPLLNTSDGVYVRTGNVNGAYGAESLPNVKGITPIGGITSPSGCFATNGSFWGVGQGGQANYSVLFNASLSSSTYQDGAKVNPRSMTYKHYIVVYNGAVSASEAQASQFINSLNGKLNSDGSNVTQAGKETITGWGMPDYAKVITINNTFFIAPCNGWIFMVASQSRILKPIVTRNGISTIVYDVGTYASDVICILVPTRIDDQWSNLTISEQLKFFPCIGG